MGRIASGEPEPEAIISSDPVLQVDGEIVDVSTYEIEPEGSDETQADRTLNAADVVPSPQRAIPVLEPIFASADPEFDGTSLLIGEAVGGASTSDANDTAIGESEGDTPNETDTSIAGEVPGVGPEPVYRGAAGSFAPEDQVIPQSRSSEDVDEAASSTSDTAVPADTTPSGEALPTGERPSASPLFFEPEMGIVLEIPPPDFDPCAGPVAGETPPPDCPPGTGATLLALHAPPIPRIFISRGHYLDATVPNGQTCPSDTAPAGDGDRAATAFSQSPLASLRVQYRPYGSDLEWTMVDVDPSSQSQIDEWNEWFSSTEFDPSWGIVPICFTIDADPEVTYEIRSVGVDLFDRIIEGELRILVADDRTTRPPTSAEVLAYSPVANVSAWTHTGGLVRFRTRSLPDPEADPTCTLTREFDPSRVLASNATPRPAIYDPDFDRLVVARIPMRTGERMLVCVDIFTDDGTLTPLTTDRVLLEAPTQQKPRIVLQGIRRIGDASIAHGLTFTSGGAATGRELDFCNRGLRMPTMPAGTTHVVEETLWECTLASSPLDSNGAADIPIQMWRSAGTEREILAELAIPIRGSDCRLGSCVQPREWFEIPIPLEPNTLCGVVFGSGGCDDTEELDGIAVVRVEYPIVEGAGGTGGSAVSLDSIDPDLPETPRLSRPEFVSSRTDAPFVSDGTLTFLSDRPLRVGVTTIERLIEEPCGDISPLPVATDFATEFSIDIAGFCAGVSYSFIVTAVDEAGTIFEIDTRSGFTIPAPRAEFDVRVDFLGGETVPRLGFIYGFNVVLDGQSPSDGFDFRAADRGVHMQCLGLDRTFMQSIGSAPVYLRGIDLDVVISFRITVTGEADCNGPSASGLGDVVLRGSFTREELASDEPLVLRTAGDQPIELMVTLNRTRSWR